MSATHDRRRPFALLVTHSKLGAELVKTAESILGVQTDVYTLSNQGLGGDDLVEAIQKRVRSVPLEQPIVLFTDLAAGSCGIASRRAHWGDREVRRITGTNLPMLLEFFHYRDTLPLDELMARLETKGKAGIALS